MGNEGAIEFWSPQGKKTIEYFLKPWTTERQLREKATQLVLVEANRNSYR